MIKIKNIAGAVTCLLILASTAMAQVTPDPNGQITASRERALQLFKAITNVPVPIDDPRLVQMETLIAAGNERGAAKIATQDPFFIDIRIRDIARKMSTRDETVKAPLSDFVATIAGVARDGIDARQLLTGNFLYQGDPAIATGIPVTPASLYTSNTHYDFITTNNLSLARVLRKVDTAQMNYTAANAAAPVANPDPAGIITSRAFLLAHADAGTNRRLVEYSFRQFMCVAMEDWMDATRADDWVGVDVDRFPGGSNDKYQTTCKACHSQMDALRPAFAYVDFLPAASPTGRVVYNTTAVVPKVARGNDPVPLFPAGFTTPNDNFENRVLSNKNSDQFVWRSAATGKGMAGFGALLAGSKGFSRCMTKRLFTGICNRAPGVAEEATVRTIADEFEKTYNLKDLAELIATNSICIAK